MKTLNRFALIVRPGAPFIEWAAKESGEPVSSVRRDFASMEPSIYLLPESGAADTKDPNLLKGHWQVIFKEELAGWSMDEDSWPKQRSEALFRAWFKLELCTIVSDLGKVPMKAEIL